VLGGGSWGGEERDFDSDVTQKKGSEVAQDGSHRKRGRVRLGEVGILYLSLLEYNITNPWEM